ncbi:MAG: glycosyltransferase [Chloroflexi bacterium]|nr:glycosyltransferase [Chloroflexota bacterium]
MTSHSFPEMRIAMLCLHGCPLVTPGQREAGGMQVYVRELSLALGRLGVEVDIFTVEHPPHPIGAQPLGPGVRVIHLESVSDIPGLSLGYPKPITDSLLRFQEMEGSPYHLVHSHYWLSAQVGGEVARRWGVPHAVMFHTLALVKMGAGAGPEPAERVEAERQAISQVQAIMAATGEEKKLLTRLYGADPARVRVIPCGLDLELFQPVDKIKARQRLRLPPGRIVLFAGRPDPIKRLDLALRAVSYLVRRQGIKELSFIVVGGEPASTQVKDLQALARNLRLGGRIHFRQACPRERMPLYYSAADIFLIPSLYESFSLATAEALACGTPVVATRAGGLKTLVKHRRNGLLVSGGTPRSFARALGRVMRDKALSRRLSEAARSSVQALDWGLVAGRVLEVYRWLIAQAR